MRAHHLSRPHHQPCLRTRPCFGVPCPHPRAVSHVGRVPGRTWSSQALFGSSDSSGINATGGGKDWLVPEQLLPTGKPAEQVGDSRALSQLPRQGGRHAMQDQPTRFPTQRLLVSAPAPPLQAGTSSSSSNPSSPSSSPSSSTVYTVRMTTSWDRGSAMSEPMAGVHVCLIGKGGSAVLHRIGPVNDPMDRLDMMRDICSSVSGPGALLQAYTAWLCWVPKVCRGCVLPVKQTEGLGVCTAIAGYLTAASACVLLCVVPAAGGGRGRRRLLHPGQPGRPQLAGQAGSCVEAAFPGTGWSDGCST